MSHAQMSETQNETNRVAATLPNFEKRRPSNRPTDFQTCQSTMCFSVRLRKPRFGDQKHRQHTRLLTRMETDEFNFKRCKSESLAHVHLQTLTSELLSETRNLTNSCMRRPANYFALFASEREFKREPRGRDRGLA